MIRWINCVFLILQCIPDSSVYSFQRNLKETGDAVEKNINYYYYMFTRLHTLMCDKIIIDKDFYLCWVSDISFNLTCWVFKYYWIISHESRLFDNQFLQKIDGAFSSAFENLDIYILCFLIHRVFLFIFYFRNTGFCGLICYHCC